MREPAQLSRAQPVVRARPGSPPPAARLNTVREHNLAVVLRAIADASPSGAPAGAPSRAHIAVRTGLTRSTVSTLVGTLIAAGFAAEVGPGPRTGAGRPGTGLRLCDGRLAGLGLELNIDYLAACVLDLAGGVRHREVVPREQRGTTPRHSVGELARLAERALAAADGTGLVVCGAAVALPGLVQGPDGPLRLAPNLGWRDVDVVGLLRRQPGLGLLAEQPVSLDNEANLAALGELHVGGAAADHPANFLYVSGEVGVGAGLILDGRIFAGPHGWGGEIGHLCVDPAGPACSCGARGCLEQFAGAEAIRRRAGLPATADRSPARLAADLLVSAAAAGEPRMLSALDDAGRALGQAVAAVLNLVDVDTVVLGGLYAQLVSWLLPAVQRQVEDRVLAHAWSPVTVRPSALGPDAAVLGAAASVVRAVIEQPAATMRRLGAAVQPA